jgi:uncharacterized protein DUF6600/FecR-like protein
MTSRTWFRSIVVASSALLFCASASFADASHARIIRLSLVQGDVRFSPEVKGDPLTSDKATWDRAILNLPIRQGYVLATDQGRAEVEFENGAMAFLADNTVLEFYDLSLEDGAKTTRLVLRQGTASFYVNPASGDYFSVTGGDFTVKADGRTSFRLDNFDDGSVLNVTKGRVSVLQKEKTTSLVKNQSFSMRAGDSASVTVGRAADPDDFDRWVSGREDTVATATVASQQYVNSPDYTSGFADLYTYGSWFPINGYGFCWRPYGVGYGWAPFGGGGWYQDPFFGWTFIGYQPWGWLPYHFGGWIFDPFFGWVWSPFGFGYGFGYGGYYPYRPVTGVFVRSKTGLLGLVPTHPLDAHGKAPINLTKGVFPVNGGALSSTSTVNSGETWKIVKNPSRDTLNNTALLASTAPTRVSRTILAGNSGSRVITVDRNSSIVYDPHEHRFVNGNSAPASTLRLAEEKAATQGRAAPVQERAAGPLAATQTSAGAARGSAPPATPRSTMPPPRAMTPPPPPRSADRGGFGGSGNSGSGRSGSSSPSWTSHGSSAPAPSAPRASAPASSGGGRPH